MLRKFVTWLYYKVVFLPDLHKRIKNSGPSITISCSPESMDEAKMIVKALERQAMAEREWIPDERLN